MTAPATTSWPSPDSGDQLAHLADSWGGSSTESPRELVAGVLDEVDMDGSSVGVFPTAGKHGFPRSTLGNARAEGFLNSAVTSELSEKSAAKEDEDDFVVDEGRERELHRPPEPLRGEHDAARRVDVVALVLALGQAGSRGL